MRLIVLLLALCVFAQGSAPDWIEESWRTLSYSKTEWYTGFVTDKVKGQPGKIEYDAVEASAKNKLSESIVVNVKASSVVNTVNKQTQSGKNFSETNQTNYHNTIITKSNAVLAKVETKSYFDKKNGYIYGFAAVKKNDLSSFYKSIINSIFEFANKELTLIEQLAEQGKKNLAHGKIQAVEDSLKNVSYWSTYLLAIESDNSHTAIEMDFLQKINNAKMSLERSTQVFLDIKGADLHSKLAPQMQNKNCNCAIAENEHEADYVVKINASLSRCNENERKEVYCYASADVLVSNAKFKKPLALSIPETKGGWTNSDKQKATDEAFKGLIENLAEKINQAINQ